MRFTCAYVPPASPPWTNHGPIVPTALSQESTKERRPPQQISSYEILRGKAGRGGRPFSPSAEANSTIGSRQNRSRTNASSPISHAISSRQPLTRASRSRGAARPRSWPQGDASSPRRCRSHRGWPPAPARQRPRRRKRRHPRNHLPGSRSRVPARPRSLPQGASCAPHRCRTRPRSPVTPGRPHPRRPLRRTQRHPRSRQHPAPRRSSP